MYVQHVGIEKICEFGVKPLENTESKNLKIAAHLIFVPSVRKVVDVMESKQSLNKGPSRNMLA